LNIVIIEDNPSERLLLELALGDLQLPSKYHFHIFESEKDYYVFFEDKNLIDFLMIDVNIGLVSGFDVLEKMKEKRVLFPICMYSNSNNEEDIHRALELKAEGYIQKPFDYNDLKKLFVEIVSNLESKTINEYLKTKS
jgi:DNA-binding response OmpR family regulator